MDSKPRIFVSSVIERFSEHREAARRGIIAAGGEPILVNEDFPSLSVSPRNACLEAVASSDIYLAIIGDRGGWTAPSGKLVVEEEYLSAKTQNIPVLLFLQRIGRDAEATRLASLMSDYVSGHFRVSYDDPRELEQAIYEAVRQLKGTFPEQKMNPDMFRLATQIPSDFHGEVYLRFIIAPERDEELIDPVKIASSDFEERMLVIGHAPNARLFSFHEPKSTGMEGKEMVVRQLSDHQGRAQHEKLVLRISEAGLVVIDSNVIGRKERDANIGWGDSMVIVKEDLVEILSACFKFVGAFFEELDPYQRHQTFYYGVLLNQIQHQSLGFL